MKFALFDFTNCIPILSVFHCAMNSLIASSWGQYGAHLGPTGPRWGGPMLATWTLLSGFYHHFVTQEWCREWTAFNINSRGRIYFWHYFEFIISTILSELRIYTYPYAPGLFHGHWYTRLIAFVPGSNTVWIKSTDTYTQQKHNKAWKAA